jgi:hypothetical protein
MSFLFGGRFENEIALMPNVGNVVTYQATQDTLAHLYDNGINYIFHGTSEEFVAEDPSYDVLQTCWNVPKLSNTHIVTDGADLNYGDRVFGFPMMVGNIPTLSGGASSALVEYLQFHHTLATNIRKVSYNDIAETAIFEISINASKLADLGLQYSDYVGEVMKLSYYNNDSGLTISGFNDPENLIEIEENCGELTCTILSVYDVEPDTHVEVHIDSIHDEDIINRVRYIAPDNQKFMILPLGNGLVADNGAGGLNIISNSFTSYPGQEGLISWSYNQFSSTMSDELTVTTPILRFAMDNLEYYKMMIVLVRNQGISKFPHGFNMKIFT